jgi:fructan beta-fructosidase
MQKQVTELLPYELTTIHNPKLRRQYEQNYSLFYFRIDDHVVSHVSQYKQCNHKIKLNPSNDYIVMTNPVKFIASHDTFPRKYMNKSNIYYITYKSGWKVSLLNEEVKRCVTCCGHYYKNSSNSDECDACKRYEGSRCKKMLIDKKYLLLPISNDGPAYRMKVYIDAVIIHEMDVNLATDDPDWWSPIDLSQHPGSTVTITVDEFSGFERICLADEIPTKEPLYDESLRPQLRFSQMYGWNNDPNGMVYYDGEYHFFWQSNPFGHNWANMYWGHAISRDLVHWKQLPDALKPYIMASGQCFSGSANISGDAMVIAFTDTDVGECLAVSRDHGRSWTYQDYNPIIPTHMGRDPKLIRYENEWMIVVYTKRDGIDSLAFYVSQDLRNWRLVNKMPGFYECPEIFTLTYHGKQYWVLFGGDARYIIGSFNGRQFTPIHKGKKRLHYGSFQASQCFSLCPDDRVIQVGWAPIEMPGMPFNQAFSLPVELSLKMAPDGLRLHGEPTKELEQLRYDSNRVSNLMLDPDVCETFNTDGQLYDVIIDFTMHGEGKLVLSFGQNIVTYNSKSSMLDDMPLGNPLHYRVIIDRPMYEICGGRGQVYKTCKRYDSGKNISRIRLCAYDCSVTINEFTVYKMKSIHQASGGIGTS